MLSAIVIITITLKVMHSDLKLIYEASNHFKSVEYRLYLQLEAMKLFEIVRTLFKYLRILPCQKYQNQTFHCRNLTVFFYQIIFITATGSYLVFRATSIYEYGELVFVFMTHFVCMCILMTLVSNMSAIMDLIEKFEKFLQTRK